MYKNEKIRNYFEIEYEIKRKVNWVGEDVFRCAQRDRFEI